MANTNPKDTKDLLKRLDRLGCVVEHGRKHLTVRFDGRCVGTLASTPSCGRALLNTVSDLRKRGVDVKTMTVDSGKVLSHV
jgi:hypothetical protein